MKIWNLKSGIWNLKHLALLISVFATVTPSILAQKQTTYCNPVNTPKKSVTPTPTLVPNPLIDFKTGCISQAWHPWYGNFQEEKSNDSKSSSDPFCWDLHNEGLEADSSGLRIFQKANDSKQVFGIFADVPEGRFSLKIDFVINELQIQLEHKDIANFFVGFVDSANTDLKGNLFVFQIPSNDLFPLVYLEDKIPFEKDTPYIESLKNYGSGITITGERDGWSINYVISGVINPDIEKNGQTFSNAWDKLLIGYSLDAGASVDMRITNIELGSEP